MGERREIGVWRGYESGSLLPGRNYSSDSYRFGFNGKEKDDEVYGSTGTSYDYGFRMYDPRIARFLSVDPIANEYPELTPYQFASLKPIWLVDIDGLEGGMLKRRHKPLISNNFNGKGLIPFLGGRRGKYFKHSVLDLPPLFKQNNTELSSGGANRSSSNAADPSRHNPNTSEDNHSPNDDGHIDLTRTSPLRTNTDTPVEFKASEDNGTFRISYDPGQYEDGTPASRSFEIGIIDPNGEVHNVQGSGPTTTPGTLQIDFSLKPGERLYYKTTDTDPKKINSGGGVQGGATRRSKTDE